MQILMEELFLAVFVVDLMLSNIFICYVASKWETALMSFYEEKILEGSVQCKHK